MQTYYVNPLSGKDHNVGSAHTPFKTLTQSLKQAKSGTVIRLAKGIYNDTNGEIFPLVIPEGVIIVGHEPSKGDGITISGGGSYTSPTLGMQNITIFLNDQAQLLGVQISNPNTQGIGVWIESAAPIVANNVLSGFKRQGVLVTGTAKPVIRDNLFTSNKVGGLLLARYAKGEVLNNIFSGNGDGIHVSDFAAPMISGNHIRDNNSGLWLTDNCKPVLWRNLIQKNTLFGLSVADDAQPDLGSPQSPAGNIFRDNKSKDIDSQTSQTLVSVGNEINPAKIRGTVNLVAAEVDSFNIGPRQFSDIDSHWAAPFIEELVKRELISGFGDGTFRPEASLTRAEYAALIAKIFDLPRQIGSKDGNFLDLVPNFWALGAIKKATQMGFISGFPDGTFRPQANLTRVQALISLVSGLGLTGGNPNLLLSYRDRTQIPSYATNATATATQRSLVVNYPQPYTLEPLRDITRAEIAAILYQTLVSTSKAPAIVSPYIVYPDPQIASFVDIGNHWAAEFIRRLADLQLISGFADGTFRPDEKLTRAQYAALLVKVFDPAPIRPAAQFIDIPPNFWAIQVIQQAYRAGFISGFPDQTFHPNQNLRRLHLIVSLTSGLKLPNADEKLLNIYEDRDSIPNYARPAVVDATQAGIVVSYPDTRQLQGSQEATRAEATVMAYQALVYKKQVNALNSPYIVGFE